MAETTVPPSPTPTLDPKTEPKHVSIAEQTIIGAAPSQSDQSGDSPATSGVTIWTALYGQAGTHAPQPVHDSVIISAPFPFQWMASEGQASTHSAPTRH